MAATDRDVEEYEDFTPYIAARREENQRPPGFRLDGELFICEPLLRAGALLDVAIRSRDVGTVAAYIAFLEDQLLPDAWDRFVPKLRDRTKPVDDDLIEKIVEKIIGDYAGRPTTESSSSATTRSKTGQSSKAGSTPRAKRR